MNNQRLCPHCGSEISIRQGISKSGAKRFFCKQCKRTFQTERQKTEHPESVKSSVLTAYKKGLSRKQMCLNFGMTRNQIDYIIQHYRPEAPRKIHLGMRGQLHNRARLSDASVMSLLVDYNENLISRQALAVKYAVSEPYVSDIIRGKSRTDNPEINQYRDNIERWDGRQKRESKPVVKNQDTELHFSVFNNVSGDVVKE